MVDFSIGFCMVFVIGVTVVPRLLFSLLLPSTGDLVTTREGPVAFLEVCDTQGRQVIWGNESFGGRIFTLSNLSWMVAGGLNPSVRCCRCGEGRDAASDNGDTALVTFKASSSVFSASRGSDWSWLGRWSLRESHGVSSMELVAVGFFVRWPRGVGCRDHEFKAQSREALEGRCEVWVTYI